MKRRTRMYEPWGYQDQNDYQGAGVILENDLDSFFAEVSYNKDDNKIHFANKDGEEKATLDVNEFVKSQVIVEKAWYENGNIHIKFTNGDEIVVDVKELLDETEFKDGLQVVEGQVSVLINTAESDEYISVGEAGIKLFGVKRDIEAEEARATSAETALDEKIDAEIERATSAETTLDEKIEKEIADRIADVDEEETRATGEEARIEEKLNNEITRATRTEQELDSKITTLATNLANENTRALAAEQELRTSLATEIADRKDDVDEEETRAKAAEEALGEKVDAETERATSAETQLQNNIDAEATARAEKDIELNGLIEAEVTRATAKETEIETNLAEEITNRTTAVTNEANARQTQDTILQDNIDAETSRATSAETALQAAIEAEGQRAQDAEGVLDDAKAEKTEAVASVEYNKANKEINFKDINGTIISTIDATDFIVDGMVEDVRIENGNLVIDFNTDSGIQDIEIPLKDIFNPANYYTKDEIDAAITAEETRATGVEGDLQTAINTEATTARAAEEANATAITLKANAADVYTKGEVDGKETALQDGIDANAAAITAEETARKNADDAQDAVIATLATKADVDAALDLKADKTEIPTDFYTKAEVEVMMSQLLTRIENLEAKESIVVADTAADVAAAPADSDIVLTSTEAIQALTGNTEFKTLTIVGGNSNADIKAIASDKLTVDGMTVNGDKGASNGRINISADTVDIKNVTIESGSTAYNVFEGSQNTSKSEFFTRSYNLSNLTADNTELNHNIANIYTPADNAVINIKDCNLNLDVDNSNLLRMANYTNATGVTINFENIEWTYENAPASDWNWAGLMIFQPASSDIALTGDTSAISTWTVNVKNCKYNGEKVTANNFGEHNQVVYLYNINKTNAVTDANEVMTINFE